jgi:hypothetical protein
MGGFDWMKPRRGGSTAEAFASTKPTIRLPILRLLRGSGSGFGFVYFLASQFFAHRVSVWTDFFMAAVISSREAPSDFIQ